MLIQCPQCQARYRIDTSGAKAASTRIRCPKCTHVFPVLIKESVESIIPSTETPSSQNQLQHSIEDKENVLVVDDSRFFRELIVDILRPMKLNCLLAGEADEALILLGEQRIGLILLDLNLPGKSGFELIRLIRADPTIKMTKILAMSGVFRKETASVESEQAGADDFINKSFKPEQLLLRVERLLREA